MKIPFNLPSLFGPEISNIKDAVRRGHLSGDGFYTQACSEWLEKQVGGARALLTPSCTHALELAYLLLGLRSGDEVIVPSFTFSSTVNAFVLRGAIPRFIDIRPDTLNMNEALLEQLVTARTRAIAPVHYAGVPCQMDRIMSVARRHRLTVVEDAAQALGATFQKQPAGSFGDFSAFSFHETKNCHCGEGGALIIRQPKHRERAEILRQKGTNRAQFLRGAVDKYTWVDQGSSFVPSELQAAYLYGQMARFQKIMRRRRDLYKRYYRALFPWQEKGHVQLPVIPPDCTSSHHLFHVLVESEKKRDRLLDQLAARGITAVIHYVPLHLSRMGRRFHYRAGQLPETERLSRRLLRLPLYNTMTRREQDYVLQMFTALL